MERASLNIRALLIIDAFLFLISCIGLYQISEKPGLPFKTKSNREHLAVKEDYYNKINLTAGDNITSIAGYHPVTHEELELLLDSKNIGDYIEIEFQRETKKFKSEIALTNFYSLLYLIITTIVGFTFLFIAVFVLIKCPGNYSARLFHWGTIFTGLIITCTWAKFSSDFLWLGEITRTAFNFSYALAPVYFFHFTLTFPEKKNLISPPVIRYIYWFAFLLGLGTSIIFYFYSATLSEFWLKTYGDVFNLLRLFLIVGVIASIIIFYHSLKTTREESERKKLLWVLYGFLIGPLSFIFLWSVPYLLFSKSFLPEEIIIFLVAALPISFAIAIIKYHLLDIYIIIKRSLVYSILLGIVVIFYLAIFSIITLTIKGVDDTIPGIVAASAIALSINPLRIKIQKIVDKKFFGVQYNFRQVIGTLLNEIKETNSVEQLAEIIVSKTDQLIPSEKIGFILLLSNNNCILMEGKNFFDVPLDLLCSQINNLNFDSNLPSAVETAIQAEARCNKIEVHALNDYKLKMIFPIKSVNKKVAGFFILGSKSSGKRFSVEDVDLINTVCSAASDSIERIKLQENLILKKVEAEKLKELNDLKSFFLSHVSHELKNPLSSISVMAELLKEKPEETPEKIKSKMNIIHGEVERLARLINNVLDFTKIEKGLKKYELVDCDLTKILNEVVELMKYQITLKQFIVKLNIKNNCEMILCDEDAVKQLLINLICNAMRFSLKEKYLEISLYHENDYICVTVIDKGIGISEEEINKIFVPFFRSTASKNFKIEGTGIGLTIVKHIADAHNARLEVISKSGSGSQFTIKFPKINEEFYNEKYTAN